MKRFQAALLCLLVCLFNIHDVLSESPKILHNAFVIEFNHVPTKRHLAKRRNHLYKRLNNEDIKHLVRHEFKYMNAVSIEVDEPSHALEYIQSLHDVKRVWPVVSIFVQIFSFSSLSSYLINRFRAWYQSQQHSWRKMGILAL